MNEEEKVTSEEMPVAQRSGLTDEERAWVLDQMEEARRKQPAYRRRMENACRHTQDTMTRRFTV